jgi:hypothetical protein
MGATIPLCNRTARLTAACFGGITMLPDTLRADPPVLMNEREVAVFLNICPRSVRNFTARKLLPVIRLGRRRLYRRDAVLTALKTLESSR